jgi:hypothetical protein
MPIGCIWRRSWRIATAGRTTDPRLQAARHNHPVCGAQHAGGQGHWPLHAASPASGIHRFLNTIERQMPAGEIVHVVLDNYAAHRHPKGGGLAGSASPLPLSLHPDLGPLAQRGRRPFAKLSRRHLKRSTFCSIRDLQAAINRFLAETNDDPKPFVWTADPDAIIAAVRRGHPNARSGPLSCPSFQVAGA